MRLDSDGSVALVVSCASARRHAGVYTCTVTNEMGQVSSSGRVTIRPQLPPPADDHDNNTAQLRYMRKLRTVARKATRVVHDRQ